MPENVADIKKNLPGVPLDMLVAMAMGGYKPDNPECGRDTTFAVLSELKRRHADNEYKIVFAILSEGDQMFFGSLLRPVAV